MSTLPALVIPGSSRLQYENNSQAKAQVLQGKFFPSLIEPNLSDLTNVNYFSLIKADPITLMEVYHTIIMSTLLKAQGLTIISNIIFYHLAAIVSLVLQLVFNPSLELEYSAKLF